MNSQKLTIYAAHDHDSQLHAVLDFYYSVVSVTPEGGHTCERGNIRGSSRFPLRFPKTYTFTRPDIDFRQSTSTSNPDESPNQTENMATAARSPYPDYDDASYRDIAGNRPETLTQHVDDGTHGPEHEYTTGASTAVQQEV
ncbi:hypothetical protein ACKAV7_012576 [Fusarium commune]